MTTQPQSTVSSLTNVVSPGVTAGSGRVPRLLVWKAWLGVLLFDVFGLGRNFARMHRCVKQWKTGQRCGSEEISTRVCTAVSYAWCLVSKAVRCACNARPSQPVCCGRMVCRRRWSSGPRSCRSKRKLGRRSAGRQSTSVGMYISFTAFGIVAEQGRFTP